MRRVVPSSQTTCASSISRASPGRATIGARSSRSAGGVPMISRSRSIVAWATWCSSSRASSQLASMPHSSVVGVLVTSPSSPQARRAAVRVPGGPVIMGPVTLGTAVLTFTLVAAALTLTPGLDTALVLRAALTQSRREALATAAGIVAGLFVWGAAAAVGVSALLTASELAFDVLRYAGAAYLVIFGVRMLVRAARSREEPAATPSAEGGSAWRAARLGLGTNLLNP